MCHFLSNRSSKKLKKELGRDYPSYTFRSQPVGNFGVGTMYSSKVSDEEVITEDIDSRWLLGHPLTWFDKGISEDDKKETMEEIIITGKTAKFSLSETISTKLGLEATVPIKEIVTVGAGIDYKKGLSVTLKADSVTDRQLNLTAFITAAENKFKPEVQKVILQREFIIGAKDIVLNGYSAEIKIDKSINPKLDVALNKAIGTTIGIDAKMKVSVQYGQNGTYVVSASEPVVAAVLWKLPPKPKATRNMFDDSTEKGSSESWKAYRLVRDYTEKGSVIDIRSALGDSTENWESRVIPKNVLQPLEKLLVTE